MLLAFWIIGPILYFVVGGFSYSHIQALYRPTCRYRARGNCDGECSHSFVAGISTVLWPVILPVIFGISLGEYGTKPNRDEKRRAKEIAEAEHKKELARIAMEEDAMLTHQLASVKNRKVNGLV